MAEPTTTLEWSFDSGFDELVDLLDWRVGWKDAFWYH